MAETNTPEPPADSGNTSGPSPSEFPCPDCGEMVREGLVRCWNCGGFLRPDVEKEFQKIQARPQQIIYSPPTEEESQVDLDTLLSGRKSADSDDKAGDFQLAGGVAPTRAAQTKPLSDTDAELGTLELSDNDEEPAPSSEAGGDTKSGPAEGDTAGEDEVAHSIATGGDAILQLAAEEEIERLKRHSERGTTVEGVKQIQDGFLIDAPKGCRIQVRDEKTGELRRLTFGSSSRVRISLLDKLEAIAKAKKAGEESGKKDTGPKHLSAGVYKRWMSDCHLHTLNPEKLKLKADSMAKEFVLAEVGFAEDGMLVASLPTPKKGGLFGGGKSKGDEEPVEPRTALLEHFRAGKPAANAPTGEKSEYEADHVAELRIVQPAASLTESLFAGIPVFGTGRVAVQLPLTEAGVPPQFLSFTLSEFREFADIIGSVYSMAEFGHNMDIPLTDTFNEHKCHYSDVKIRALEGLAYYEADPEIETVLAGWLCTSCGIVVSEDARQKEKLGGKAGKSIAKAKCPKCEEKFGSNPLYTLASTVQSASITGEEPEGDAGADEEASAGA